MFHISVKKSIKPIIYNPRKSKANKVFLFTNARDEKYIAEWVAHHLLLGFDAIIIFDHKSIIPIQNIFNSNDKRIIVNKCILASGAVKIPLMKQAVEISKKQNADWFLYLDCDEYLCLNKFNDIKEMLNVYYFADSLSINWLMFGSSFHHKDPGPLMENYTKSCVIVDKHVKTFVRPETVIGVENPHYFFVYNPLRMFGIPNKLMKQNYAFNDTKIHHKSISAYIAHYVYQSEESFIRRKINLPADDNGIKRKLNLSLLTLYNDHDNFDLKNKYSEKVKEKVKKITKT